MPPFVGIFLLLVILAVAWVTMSGRVLNLSLAKPLAKSPSVVGGMAASPTEAGRPASDCVTRFFARPRADGQTEYCVKVGGRALKCEPLPLPAIIAANEMPDSDRCNKITWGFGCEKGVLCGLRQSGPNIVSEATAGQIAREQCGQPRARLWC